MIMLQKFFSSEVFRSAASHYLQLNSTLGTQGNLLIQSECVIAVPISMTNTRVMACGVNKACALGICQQYSYPGISVCDSFNEAFRFHCYNTTL